MGCRVGWKGGLVDEYMSMHTTYTYIYININRGNSLVASQRMLKDPRNFALGMEAIEAAGFMVDCFSDWCHKKNALERECLI